MKQTASIDKIFWNANYSVGIAELDAQHKRLFELVNELIDDYNQKKAQADLAGVLNNLTDYCFEHLSKEEQLMYEHDYPSYRQHKEAHDAFRSRNGQFHIASAEGNPEVMAEIISFLTEWLTTHILKVDVQYKTFFDEIGLA